MNFKIILVIILSGFALIFLAQNIQVVTVSFLFWEISMSRAVLIFLLVNRFYYRMVSEQLSVIS